MQLPIDNSAAAAQPTTLALAPLDVPLNVEVGRALDPSLVAQACRRWEGARSEEAARVTISIEATLLSAWRSEVAITLSGSAMEIVGPGVRAHVDLDQKCAEVCVANIGLGDVEWLRQVVLEPVVLMLITAEDRAPLHASGFIVDGLAIVLAGPSGSGKSCLARAADSAGLRLLSDDAVYVQRSPQLRVWGWPGAVHLLPADTASRVSPTRIRNGKIKHVVEIHSASSVAISCDRAVLCVLAHGEKPALTPVSADEALERLWPLDPGFDLMPEPIGAAVRALAARGAWELRLSKDPHASIRLILASLSRLASTAAG